MSFNFKRKKLKAVDNKHAVIQSIAFAEERSILQNREGITCDGVNGIEVTHGKYKYYVTTHDNRIYIELYGCGRNETISLSTPTTGVKIGKKVMELERKLNDEN